MLSDLQHVSLVSMHISVIKRSSNSTMIAGSLLRPRQLSMASKLTIVSRDTHTSTGIPETSSDSRDVSEARVSIVVITHSSSSTATMASVLKRWQVSGQAC